MVQGAAPIGARRTTNSDLKAGASFTSDYPFPCLLNPEPDEITAGDAAPEEDDEEAFELDEFVTDLGNLRLSSNIRKHEAFGEDGQPLVRDVGIVLTSMLHQGMCIYCHQLGWGGWA